MKSPEIVDIPTFQGFSLMAESEGFEPSSR